VPEAVEQVLEAGRQGDVQLDHGSLQVEQLELESRRPVRKTFELCPGGVVQGIVSGRDIESRRVVASKNEKSLNWILF
jgi:hypothetical protein